MQVQRDTDTLQTGKHEQAIWIHTLTMIQTDIQGQTSWTYMYINHMQAAGICRREIYAGRIYMQTDKCLQTERPKYGHIGTDIHTNTKTY